MADHPAEDSWRKYPTAMLVAVTTSEMCDRPHSTDLAVAEFERQPQPERQTVDHH